MSRFLFAALTFMVIFSLATAATRCPVNEVYSNCGTACPATCKDRSPQVCTLQCVQGCVCKGGLVRNSKGRCVPPVACNCDA